MRNSSHKPECIRALPASQSCHVRRVEWMRSAAAVCEIPAASRAARTSSGVGVCAALPARLRLGWLDMLPRFQHLSFSDKGKFSRHDDFISLRDEGFYRRFVAVIPECFLRAKQIAAFFVCIATNRVYRPTEISAMRCDDESFHFLSPAPVPEARCKRSVYDLKYTRIPCKCKRKRFLKYFQRAQNKPSNGGGQRRDD